MSDWRQSLREREYGSLDEHRSYFRSIGPRSRLYEFTVPTLFVHGENDPRIPVETVSEFASDIQKQGTKTDLLVLEDEGHRISDNNNRATMCRRTLEFLRETV
jgi:dipeptidyl aminopeptidase/acylaminoacyl peptidase